MGACVCMLGGFNSIVHQTALPMEISRPEYWSGFPFPAPTGLPDPGIELAFLVSPASAGRFFTSAPPGKPWVHVQTYYGIMPFLLDAQRAFCMCGKFFFTSAVIILSLYSSRVIFYH